MRSRFDAYKCPVNAKERAVHYEPVCRATWNSLSQHRYHAFDRNKISIARTVDQSRSGYRFQCHFANHDHNTQRRSDYNDLEIVTTEPQTLLFYNSRPVIHRSGSWSREHTSFHLLFVKLLQRKGTLLLRSKSSSSIHNCACGIICNCFGGVDIWKIRRHCASLFVQYWGDEEKTLDVHCLLFCDRDFSPYSRELDSAGFPRVFLGETHTYFLAHSLRVHKNLPRG